MPQPARGPPTGPRTGGPWSSGPVLGPRGTVGPPYGPKDRGPLVLRAGGGTSGRPKDGGRPLRPKDDPWPRTPSVLGPRGPLVLRPPTGPRTGGPWSSGPGARPEVPGYRPWDRRLGGESKGEARS